MDLVQASTTNSAQFFRQLSQNVVDQGVGAVGEEVEEKVEEAREASGIEMGGGDEDGDGDGEEDPLLQDIMTSLTKLKGGLLSRKLVPPAAKGETGTEDQAMDKVLELVWPGDKPAQDLVFDDTPNKEGTATPYSDLSLSLAPHPRSLPSPSPPPRSPSSPRSR